MNMGAISVTSISNGDPRIKDKHCRSKRIPSKKYPPGLFFFINRSCLLL